MLLRPRSVRASALEQIDVLKVHRLTVAEYRDDDGEPDGRFGRRDSHYEYDEHLARRSVKARERDERQVDGRQHQLHAHEDDDRVAVNENADHSDDEERGGQSERLSEHRLPSLFRGPRPPLSQPEAVRSSARTPADNPGTAAQRSCPPRSASGAAA